MRTAKFTCIDCLTPISTHALRCKKCAGAVRHKLTDGEKQEAHRRYMRLYYQTNAAQREKAKSRASEYRKSEAYAASRERHRALMQSRCVEPPKINDVELAYVAGIIDGEGSIQIRKVMGCNGEVNFTYELSVTVTNVFPHLVQHLAKLFGGSVCKDAKRDRDRCERTTYRWTICAERAEWFLRTIEPFVVCKRDQIALAKRFRESFVVRNRNPRTPTPPDKIAFRQKCYDEMKALHRVEWESFEFDLEKRKSGDRYPLFTTIAGQGTTSA